MAKKKAPKKSTKKAAKPAKRPIRPAARKAKAPAKAKAVRKPLKTKKAKKAAPKKLVRKVARKVVKKTTKVVRKAAKAVRKVTKPVRKAPKPVARKAPARKPAPVKKAASVKKAAPVKKAEAPPPAVRLQRERRRLPEVEAEGFTGTGGDARLLRSAKSGHDELRSELRQHTESSPELTAGDVDAKWQDAYALGDEAPGGDNMTPDQDRVDDIGKALGIQYDDDEELQGGAEVTARDESRWELDPESKEEDEDE